MVNDSWQTQASLEEMLRTAGKPSFSQWYTMSHSPDHVVIGEIAGLSLFLVSTYSGRAGKGWDYGFSWWWKVSYYNYRLGEKMLGQWLAAGAEVVCLRRGHRTVSGNIHHHKVMTSIRCYHGRSTILTSPISWILLQRQCSCAEYMMPQQIDRVWACPTLSSRELAY